MLEFQLRNSQRKWPEDFYLPEFTGLLPEMEGPRALTISRSTEDVDQKISPSTHTNPMSLTTMCDTMISTGIPNGLNGFFPWIWWWTDGNQMTDDGLNLNATGNELVSHYYSHVTN